MRIKSWQLLLGLALLVSPLAVQAAPNPVVVKDVKLLELPGRQSWNGFTWYPGMWWVNGMTIDPREKKVWLATNVGLMSLDLDELQLQRWTVYDGLPDSYINDVALGDKGTVWVATYNGVSRMDKQGFKNWSGKQVGYHNLSRITVDSDGWTWVGSAGRKPMGAMCLVGGDQWLMYNKWALDAEFMDAVNDAAPDAYGGVWFAGTEGKAASVFCEGYYQPLTPRLSHVDHYGAPKTLLLDNIWPEKLAVEKNGELLVLCRDKLRRLVCPRWFNDGQRRIPDLMEFSWQDINPETGTPPVVTDLFRDDEGKVWLASERELGYLDAGRYIPQIQFPEIGRYLNHFAVMKNGRRAVFTVNPATAKDRSLLEYRRGVFVWDGIDWKFVTTRVDGPSEQSILGASGRDVIRGDLHFIRQYDQTFDGKRWSVGQPESGLFLYSKGTWGRFVSMKDGMSFVYDRYGRVVANCTWDSAKHEALLWTKESEKPVAHKEYFGIPLFPAMYRDSLGHYWSYGDELKEFDGKQIIDHSAANPVWFRKIPGVGDYNRTVRGLAEDSQGRLFAATTWGVLLYENREHWRWVGGRFEGLRGMLGWHFASNGSNLMSFAGTWGVTEYDMLKDEWKNWTMTGLDYPGYTQKLPGSYAESVAADSQGRMWYGTLEGGVCYHDPKTDQWGYISTKDGLATSSILGIWSDDDGSMWFTSQSGIQKLDMKQFGTAPKP